MAETKKRAWLIGLITFGTIVVMYFFYNFLKGSEVFDKNDYYYVYFDEVDGLYESNKVLINGMHVGQVSSIEFAPDRSGRLLVELQVEQGHAIQKGSTASIVNTGLIGGRMVRLNDTYGPGPYVQNGDTLQGLMEPSYAEAFNLDFESLILRTDTLLQNLNKLTRSVNAVIDEEAQNQISQAITHFYRTSALLEKAMREMPLVLEHIDSTVLAVGEAGVAVESMSYQIKGIVDTLNREQIVQLLADAQASVESLRAITARMQNGEGTLGKLSTNDSLYLQLQATLVQVDSLVYNIRRNPKKYLRISVF